MKFCGRKGSRRGFWGFVFYYCFFFGYSVVFKFFLLASLEVFSYGRGAIFGVGAVV